jgi:Ca2+-binding RTX toxin-like protein
MRGVVRVNYPNEGDFWEIVSRKLVEALLTNPIPTPYGVDYRLAEMVDQLSISLTVHPDVTIPYTRSSTVEQEVLTGTVGVDHLDGGFYGDAIRGDVGGDWLRGLDGNDYLSGGSGNDRLFGGQGKDTLAGGTGADWLTGGVVPTSS